MKKLQYKALMLLFALGFLLMTACSKSQSYSELLREEEKACNWFLSNRNVALELPADPEDMITGATLDPYGVEYGDNAPFYKLDEEGYVYMQVVRAVFDDPVAEGDLVYFRFVRESIKDLYEGVDIGNAGNSEYLPNGSTSFVYRNNYLSSSTKWGTGVQMPLQYMGYNSEVNIVLKSYYGFTEEQSYCIPYIMNVRYFKPEY